MDDPKVWLLLALGAFGAAASLITVVFWAGVALAVLGVGLMIPYERLR